MFSSQPWKQPDPGWRRALTLVAATALVSSSAALSGTTIAQAAPGDMVHGTVSVDSDKNGVLDATGPIGGRDTGVAGVTMTLKGTKVGHGGWTTTTDAQGHWSFPVGDYSSSPGPYTVFLDASSTSEQAYLTHTAATADNVFTRVGSEKQLASVGTFDEDATAVAVDALVYPTLVTSLANKLVETGTAPFDSAAGLGKDTSATDDMVRTGDLVNFNWSASISPEEDLHSDVTTWFEQTLDLTGGATATFNEIPDPVCQRGSTITVRPSGTQLKPAEQPPAGTTHVVLSCNLGPTGSSKGAHLLETTVKVSQNSAAGTSFTSSARTYGADANGTTTARPSPGVESGPFKTTGAPRYDLQKTGVYIGGEGNYPVNGTTIHGYPLWWNMQIVTDRSRGVEAFQQDLHIEEALWGEFTDAAGSLGAQGSQIPDLTWYVQDCAPSPGGHQSDGRNVAYGKIGTKLADGTYTTAENSARDSGTCTASRANPGDTTSPYTLTLSGIDTSGLTYPTKSHGGWALAADKFVVASYMIRVIVPLEELDKTIDTDSDRRGSARFWNRVGDFNPVGLSGAPNHGDGIEPGYCDAGPVTDRQTNCDLINGKASNNVAGPAELSVSSGNPRGKSFVSSSLAYSFREYGLPESGGIHDGQGQVQPGQVYTADQRLDLTVPATNVGHCDVFDNRTLKLVPLKSYPRSDSAQYPYPDDLYSAAVEYYGQEADRSKQLALQQNYVTQYASVTVGDDTANTGEFDTKNSRWKGNWTNQRALTQGCAPGATWYDTPQEVPGGVDAVNVVRLMSKDGYTVNAQQFRWLLAFEQRNTFNGGPLDGQEIPQGTVSANFGSYTHPAMAQFALSDYVPGAGNTGGNRTDESGSIWGDRWTLTRAALALKKHTIDGTVNGVTAEGAADVDTPGTAGAGKPVIWEVNGSLSAATDHPAPVTNVTVTDTLPKGVEYLAEATAALPGAKVPEATAKADGTTTLVWRLGTLMPNEKIPSLRIATLTDPMSPNGTLYKNTATITADGIINRPQHTDDHTVRVTQSGSLQLQKSVDHTLDLADDEQKYTLKVQNFSEKQTIEKPIVYEVFSYNGDTTNDAQINRSPGSKFSGTTQLTAEPKAFLGDGKTVMPGTFFYTTTDPKQVPQNLDNDTDASIWSETFTPEATAFKFLAGQDLDTFLHGNPSGLQITFTTDQAGNQAGDLYLNRFTAFSEGLKNGAAHQILGSNQTTVRVVGFSLGDLVWKDLDGNGQFDAATDVTAPHGITVQVRDSSDAVVATTTTDKDGRWLVNDLPMGEYYVTIGAAEFAPGAPLHGWVPQPVGLQQDPETDANEDVGHHAIIDPDRAGGVRSTGLILLSADTKNGVITGLEPIGDNVASLSTTPGTGDTFTNFTLDLAFKPVPGYEFTKVASPATTTAVQAGDEITYTLRGTNSGTSDLAVTITDDLSEVAAHGTVGTPTAAVAGAITVPDPEITGTELTWTGTLKPGQAVVVRYIVTLDNVEAGDTVRNAAVSVATPPHEDPITPPEVSTEHPVPGFEVAKTSLPTSGKAVAAGGTITYTVTGTNTGATVLDPVVLTDDLADVLAHASLVGTPTAVVAGQSGVAAPSMSGTTLTWRGTLAVGQSVMLGYTVQVDDDAAGSTLVNEVTGTATPPDLPPLTPPSVSTEHPVPGYEFAKTSDPADGNSVLPGGTITYTLTGTNTGATTLNDVEVSDDLSEVLAHASLTGTPTVVLSGGGSAAPVEVIGTELAWSGTLAIGENVAISYTVTLNDDAHGVVLHNSAESSATPPGVPTITPPPVETWHPTPGYTFYKSADPVSGTSVLPGETITYSLTGTNSGETLLEPVEISDDLSQVLAHAELVGAPSAEIVKGGVAAPAADPALTGTELSWSGSLQIGEQVVVTYRVRLGDDATGAVLKNAASSTATPPGHPSLPPIEGTTEHPVPGYELAKTSDPASGSKVGKGETITWTVTGTNTGATALDPVTISDSLAQVLTGAALVGDPEAVIVAADGTRTPATAPSLKGTDLTWSGALAIGEQVELTYRATVTAEGPAALRNVVTSVATPPHGSITPPPSETTHEVPPNPDVEGETEDKPDPGEPETTPEVEGETGQHLPETGSPFSLTAGLVSLTAILAGLVLTVVARRRRTE